MKALAANPAPAPRNLNGINCRLCVPAQELGADFLLRIKGLRSLPCLGDISGKNKPHAFDGLPHPFKGLRRASALGQIIEADCRITAPVPDFKNVDFSG